jgi:hypothetical protein
MRIISDSYLKLLTIPLPQSMNLYFGATEYPRILRMVLTEKGPPLYSGLYDFSIYRSPGNQKNVCRMYQVVRRNTPATASSRQPQTTNKRAMAVS